MLTEADRHVQTAHADPPRLRLADTPGAFVLQFGKFRGHTLAQVPGYYVNWLAEFHDWPDVREAARAYLDWSDDDESDVGPDPDPESAAVKLPLLVWLWEEEMTLVHGDDPATDTGAVVCHGRAVLRSLCEQTTGQPFPRDEEGGTRS